MVCPQNKNTIGDIPSTLIDYPKGEGVSPLFGDIPLLSLKGSPLKKEVCPHTKYGDIPSTLIDYPKGEGVSPFLKVSFSV